MQTVPSTRRGLLISSPRNGLIAAGPSLTRMREFLIRQQFVLADEHCIDGDGATRAAIIAGFSSLIDVTGSADTIVVYYAGHGGLFPDRVGATIQSHPGLEPMDIADSDANHYNGLLGGELRLFIRALARLCDNVTAIFDCCHASGLTSVDQLSADMDEARDREALAAVAQRAGERIARRRAETAAAQHGRRSATDPASTGAVRLVASSASERAYACPGRPMLLFTDTLVNVLEDYALAQELTWEQIIRVVRASVQEIRPEQRPGVEGARERRPFKTTAVPVPVDHFHVQRDGQRLRLTAGGAAGIRRFEHFELLPYAGDAGDAGPVLGTAQAMQVQPFHATLETLRGQGPLPSVMFARRVRTGGIKLAARLSTAEMPGDQIAAATLHARLAARGHQLREPITSDTPVGYLDLLDEQSPNGHPDIIRRVVARLPLAGPHTPDELARAMRRLERWAGLATQIGHPGLGPLAGCYTLTWGRLADGELTPLGPGAVLHAGEPLSLRIHNPGHASAIHFQAFRVRADRCIDAWRDVDGGLAVMTGHELTVQESFSPIPNLPGPQQEWLVVAIGDGAFELAALATPTKDRPRGPVTRSPDHPGEASRVEIFAASYTLVAAP